MSLVLHVKLGGDLGAGGSDLEEREAICELEPTGIRVKADGEVGVAGAVPIKGIWEEAYVKFILGFEWLAIGELKGVEGWERSLPGRRGSGGAGLRGWEGNDGMDVDVMDGYVADHVAAGGVMAGGGGVAGVVEAVPVGDVAIDGDCKFVAGGGAMEDADELAGGGVDAEGDEALHGRGEELDFYAVGF